MIHLEEVRFDFPQSQGEILRGITTTFSEGERVVITGRNGSGKSTFLRILAGLLEPSNGVVQFDPPEVEFGIGLIQQNPETQLICSTVEKEIAFGLENSAVDPVEIRRRVEETLEKIGLQSLRNYPPHKLSGGEMQKVAFAAIYALNPKIWLLDEPVTYLDPVERENIIQLLEIIPDDNILIFATCDPEEFTIGQRLLVLHEGRIIADDIPEKIFTGDSLEIAKVSSQSFSQPEQDESGSPSELRDEDIEHMQSITSLKVKGLNSFRKSIFEPSKQVLYDIDLEITGSEIVCLLGASGSGKTTLIEALAGLGDHVDGEVSWGRRKPQKMYGEIGVAFQFPERSFFAETVFDEVAFGPRNLKKSNNQVKEIVEEALITFGLDPEYYGEKNPFELSGGEARRTALASIRALRPAAYLLDEPTAGLDEESCILLEKMLKAESERGCIILIAGHDTEKFSRWCDRFILLENGRITWDNHSIPETLYR
ncbi:MAG: ABC transporter ATP-binding protein [Candidatus Electryonea clarkiae]|nr:ABC transporter ATP-binding protein [Candidatus Electryonea clarkiae]MDP8285203.1 ABC transporter ATP-binding protein [Candidatus Electryonea clarkiae]